LKRRAAANDQAAKSRIGRSATDTLVAPRYSNFVIAAALFIDERAAFVLQDARSR
jgi:hypothetical protein